MEGSRGGAEERGAGRDVFNRMDRKDRMWARKK